MKFGNPYFPFVLIQICFSLRITPSSKNSNQRYRDYLQLLPQPVEQSNSFGTFQLARRLGCLAALSVLLGTVPDNALFHSSVAQAEVLIESVTVVDDKNVNILSDTESGRVKRKLELQQKAKGSEGKSFSSDESGFMNSIQREQQKQKAMKKSKSERSRDLCESLGRGC